MKTLLIMRHAKSSWNYPEFSDYERPLNKRGKRDAPSMGEHLHRTGLVPGSDPDFIGKTRPKDCESGGKIVQL